MHREPGKHPNHLVEEKSPYLLQHAFNPVDWHPWGAQAFDKAHRENKPILLSIGYSTCHWCHVMEQESFEDPHVAALMNEAFVSIKVDREERPDIDNVYMAVCQALTGSGGWPLTIILTPDRKPFFAGTYFPKESRLGRIGMLELAPRVKELWNTRQGEVLTSAQNITAELRREGPSEPGEELGKPVLTLAYEQLAQRFDERYGGFGTAPKFPTPHNLLFLLRRWIRTSDEKAVEMVEKTLQAVRRGGVYDHVGYGFHRYSTDARWLVPHFEKMLYDQSMLAMAYTEAYQATGNEEYKRTAQETFAYILRDMTAPNAAFYSAEDADSEGIEGKFYIWTQEELRHLLGEEAALVSQVYGVEKEGNFTQDATGLKTGANILHLEQPLYEVAARLRMPEQQLRRRLEAARQALFAAREKRAHPHKDDKILADWNGLMIAALAKAGQALDDPSYVEAAKGAADFILKSMRSPDGRLIHRYRDGQAAVPACLDDYAFLIWGMIELYGASFEVRYLQTALELNLHLMEHFWDRKDGGFYFTADDSESLLVRQKETYDGASPSGNSVAMLNLLRLGRMTGNAELEEKAVQIGRAFSTTVTQAPSSYTQLMVGVDFAVGPSYEVVIAGDSQAYDTRAMVRALRDKFIPNAVVILRPSEEESPDITRLAEFTKRLSSADGKATAYICHNFKCELPTTDVTEMLNLLHSKQEG